MNKRIVIVGLFALVTAIAGMSGSLRLSTPKPTAPAPQGWCPPLWVC